MTTELYLTLARATLRDTAASVEKTQLAQGVITLAEANESLAGQLADWQALAEILRGAVDILERPHGIAKAS